MKTIKLTYILELEVPEETLLEDGDRFIHGVREMLMTNVFKGWKTRLRRLVGVTKGDAPQNQHTQGRFDA